MSELFIKRVYLYDSEESRNFLSKTIKYIKKNGKETEF